VIAHTVAWIVLGLVAALMLFGPISMAADDNGRGCLVIVLTLLFTVAIVGAVAWALGVVLGSA